METGLFIQAHLVLEKNLTWTFWSAKVDHLQAMANQFTLQRSSRETGGSDSQFSSIYVHTLHPLVFMLIEKLLISNLARGRVVQKFIGTTGPSTESEEPLIIVDTVSIRQWEELLARWHSAGNPVIILVSQDFDTEKHHLIGTYLGADAIVKISPRLEEDLLQAIKTVGQGQLWISRNTLNKYVKQTSLLLKQLLEPDPRVTAREGQILSFLTRGFSNSQIAVALQISERTVKFHVSNILRKLGIESRRELVGKQQPWDCHVSASPSPARQPLICVTKR